MECVGLQKRFMLLIAAYSTGFLATVLVIIGLCTNNWVELRERNLYRNSITVSFGLHRVCWVSNDRCNNPGSDYDQQNSLSAVQGILISGGFVSAIATLITLFNLLQDRLGRSSALISIGNAAAAAIGGIMLLVGIIVFATKVKVRTEYIAVGQTDFLGYSFGLTTCAGLLMFVTALTSGLTGFSSAEQKFNRPHILT